MRLESASTLPPGEKIVSKRYVLCRSAFLWSFVLLLLTSVSFVILPACAPVASAAVPLVVVAAQKFDPEGEFNVLGDPPRALSEVSTIELLRDAKRSFYNPHAGLYTTAGVTYRFKTLSVTRAKFTFTTMPIKGISYSFTGRFLRGGVYAELDSDQWGKPILEGKLSKLKGSQKVSEANLKFSYFGGA
jgi:hypothetical protein